MRITTRIKPKIIILLSLAMLWGCTGVPEGIEPVSGFDIRRYLGTWYEIARLDHSFERGLSRVTAEYRLREDGRIDVINRGYSIEGERWKEAVGIADFVGETDRGHLKVSFFGPFYGSYIVFDLERDGYRYAYVTGPNRSYLWLLARSPQVSPDVMERFKSRTASLGYDTQRLIIVDHP